MCLLVSNSIGLSGGLRCHQIRLVLLYSEHRQNNCAKRNCTRTVDELIGDLAYCIVRLVKQWTIWPTNKSIPLFQKKTGISVHPTVTANCLNSGIDTVVIVYNNNIQNKECYFIKASKGHNEKSTKKNDTNRNQVAHNVGSENLMIESLGGGNTDSIQHTSGMMWITFGAHNTMKSPGHAIKAH